LGTAASQAVLDLVDALVARQADHGLDCIHSALDAGSDPRQFGRQVVDYLRDLLLMRMGNADQVDATPEVRAQMARHAQAFGTADLLKVIRLFNRASNEARAGWQPALPLEMAFIESLVEPQAEVKPSSDLIPSSKPAPVGVPRKKTAPPPPAVRDSAPTAPLEVVLEPEGAIDENGLTLQTVNNHWQQILALVRQRNPQTQGLLNSCKPFGVKDGVLFLGFTGEFAKSKMEREENITITKEILVQVLGMEVPLRCFVVSSRRGGLPPDVDSDGMVAAALRDLGGEIVDIQ
jgi:DNA polymerase-3 subunit gamma/tau